MPTITNITKIKEMYKNRYARRGYHDFVKMSLGVLVSFIILIFAYFNVLERFEVATFDYRMRLRSRQAPDERVVFIEIAEDSIAEIGRWPWSRDWHAAIISALSSVGARAIVFDVLFSEASAETNDAAMEEAIKTAGRVYIPCAFEMKDIYHDSLGWHGRNIITPLERFSKWAQGDSYITIFPDSDGVIRRVLTSIEYNGKRHFQLALKVALDVMDIDASRYEELDSFFGRYIRMGKKEKSLLVPVDDKDQMLVNWVGKWGQDFKHYSFIEVLACYKDMLDGEKTVIDMRQFKDKICVIGVTALGLHDVRPNPLESAYPAAGTNANVISNILRKSFVKKAPRWADALLIVLLGFFLSKNVYWLRPKRGMLITALLITAYILFSFVVLNIFKIWISLVYPLLCIISAYLVITSYNYIVVSAERMRLFTLATKDGLTGLYVIRHFRLLLEAQMEIVRLNKSRLSLLMLDFDNFKKINDENGHQVGDFILKEAANIVASICRPLDISARYGGEEFIVMLPGADANGAALVAERIRRKVEETDFKLGSRIYRATVSIGAAVFRSEDTIDDFIRKADEALYKAKARGRNRVSLSVSDDQL